MRGIFLKILVFATCLALSIQVGLVVIQVIAPGVISDAFTHEVSKYLMSWVALVGVPIAILDEGLLGIRLWQQCPSWWRKLTKTTRICSTALMCAVLLGFGIWNAFLTFHDGKTTDALGWPKVWVAVSLPFGMILAIAALVMAWRSDEKA